MKRIHWFIIVVLVFCGGVGADNDSEKALAIGNYQGHTQDQVTNMLNGFRSGIWPGPEKVGYFDPSGGESNVLRYGMWSTKVTPVKGVIVHFNGRTEFIEKNIYAYEALTARGYDVWAMDWRGQGLSQRLDKSLDKERHHIEDFQTYVDDAHYFITKIVGLSSNQGKKILLAHSMGGQIALRYLIEHKKEFDLAVLSSPLLRLPGDTWYLRFGNWVKSVFLPTSCVITKDKSWQSDFVVNDVCAEAKEGTATKSQLVQHEEKDKGKLPPALGYTNDTTKLAEINCMISQSIDANGKKEPDLRLACPTSSWLRAAFSSTDIVFEKGSEIKVPILIVRAGKDPAVDPKGQDDFKEKNHDNVELVDLTTVNGVTVGHELLIEIPEVMQRFMAEFDRFVAEH